MHWIKASQQITDMKLGSPEAMRLEVFPRDPREDEPDYDCETCHDTCELPNGDVCPECCPHDDKDGCWCLVCNTDISEHMAGAAEFRADCNADR